MGLEESNCFPLPFFRGFSDVGWRGWLLLRQHFGVRSYGQDLSFLVKMILAGHIMTPCHDSQRRVLGYLNGFQLVEQRLLQRIVSHWPPNFLVCEG